MNAALNYILEANICLCIFLLTYFILLGRETQFTFKRLFLLSALIFSLLFPLIHLQNAASSQFIPSVSQAIPPYFLPELVITDGEAQPVEQAGIVDTFWTVVFYIYLTGVALWGLVFACQLIKLFNQVKRGKKYQWDNCLVTESTAALPAFSFFSFVFLGQADRLKKEEKIRILQHERFHATQLHSFDLVLATLASMVFWFNPIVRIYKSLLVQLHEFQADAHVAETCDTNSYCKLLAKVALQSNGFTIVNHFNKSLTLQRISMMKGTKKKLRNWKIAATVTTLPLVFFVVACQDQVIEEMNAVAQNATMVLDYPKEVQTALEKLKEEFPGGNFNVIKLNEDGQNQIKEIEKRFGTNIQSLSIIDTGQGDTDGGRYAILNFTGQVNDLIEIPADSGAVFTIVEEPGKPAGGMKKYFQYIGDNLEYPSEAVKAGIEGKVYISFVIEKDGSLSNVEVIKGIGGGCDEEAVRVIKEGPAWTPGKQRGKLVKQKMILPILFRLGNADRKALVEE